MWGLIIACRAISIHVPREGDDGLLSGVRGKKRDFNPRPP